MVDCSSAASAAGVGFESAGVGLDPGPGHIRDRAALGERKASPGQSARSRGESGRNELLMSDNRRSFQMDPATRHLRKTDPVMAAIIDRVGPCRWTVRKPTFETLVRSITFQQLHGKAAATIFARLKAAVGPRFTATGVLRLSEAELRACGLSRQKIASITDLAEHVVRRRIQFSKLARPAR